MLSIGCLPTRNITEKQIKTQIEVHKPGEQTSIRLFSIYKKSINKNKDYIELTCFKSEKKSGLLIGVIKNIKLENPRKFNESDKQTFFKELSLGDCESIVQNYFTLLGKIQFEKVKVNEIVYHDFTLDKDIFISLKKGQNVNPKFNLDLWIYGENYTVKSTQIIRKLQKFIQYAKN